MKTYKSLLLSTLFLMINSAHAGNSEELVNKMLEASVSGDQSKVLEIRNQIESLPASLHGNRKAARELNTQGLTEFSNNNFDSAANIFLQAHKTDPEDAEISTNLGYSYLRLNKYDEAKTILVSSLALSPGRSSAWSNLAQVYAQGDDLTHAVAAFNLTWAFSQNKEKTKIFLEKLVSENPGTATATAALKSIEHQATMPVDSASAKQPSVSPQPETEKEDGENLAAANAPLHKQTSVQDSENTPKSTDIEEKTKGAQIERPGLPGLRLGETLNPQSPNLRCRRPTEFPELCSQAKAGIGDGSKARCIKQLDKDSILDTLQLCRYPYKNELAGSKVEGVDVLILENKVIEIRSVFAVPIDRLLLAYETKYGEAASFEFKINDSYGNYSALNNSQKKVHDERRGGLSAVLSAGSFDVDSVTWWTGNGTDMVLALPPTERVHNNAKDTLSSENDDGVTAMQKIQMQQMIGFGLASAYSDNPWTIYYTDFQSLIELSEKNTKFSSESAKKRLDDL